MLHVIFYLRRFASEFALRIAPAALASAIGGVLFTQYGAAPPAPVAVQAQPAGEEMMRMVRDEHALLADFLREQTQAKKREIALADRAIAVAKVDAAPAKAPKAAPRPKAVEMAKAEPRAPEPPAGEPLPLNQPAAEPPGPSVVASLTAKAQAAGAGAWSVMIGAARLPGRIWSAGEDLIGGATSSDAPARLTQAAL